jgi:tetratricopeptide (TPR) repeat protein
MSADDWSFRVPRKSKTTAKTPPAPAVVPRASLSPADRAVCDGPTDATPAELRAGAVTVRDAFAAYEAGQDDRCRELLQNIGLTSAFLEWKVLLRGLLAHAANDDAKAIDNWQRLKPDNLPARLVAPVRFAIDPTFRAAQPTAVGQRLAASATALTAPPIYDSLKKLQAELGRDQNLTKVWKLLGTLLPAVQASAPELTPRLANCLYRTLTMVGQQTDVPKYRKLFGSPVDDPNFERVEALGFEAAGQPDVAADYWIRYERWLATGPPGWPTDLLRRARAVLLRRIGDLLADAAEQPVDDFPFSFGPKTKKKARDPLPFYRRSVELADGWPPATLALLEAMSDKPEQVEALARAYTAAHPGQPRVLQHLADSLKNQGRMHEWRATAADLLATNPLDKRLQDYFGLATLAAARRSILDGDPDAAEALLAAAWPQYAQVFPASIRVLRATAARLAGRLTEADRWQAEALQADRRTMAAAYYLAVDGLLAKLKPAVRKPADARLAEVFAARCPDPHEANMLFGAYNMFVNEGLTYRGQKTHLTKIVAVAERAVESPLGNELDFEVLVRNLERHRSKSLATLAGRLASRFPTNPVFVLVQLAAVVTGDREPNPRQLGDLIAKAKKLVEQSPHERHRALANELEDLQAEVASPFDLFDLFFNRR